ncbi:CaiB/BaiF CoA-transferase family protein [Clostridium sediminicola]|uniref:CaiB/BaiF CoA transferase family protein n=1 Tax=Clostridium sediminicola TaxID=3114879 RepID=UPI0031F1C9AB
MKTFKKPFEGIKVLDFTQALAGVFCAYQMSDLGATVWKVERYKYGDQSRVWPPFVNDIALGYASFNKNKKSISIDMRKEEGKQIILDMVKECDVVLENFKVGTLEKLGLGYEELIKVNPNIIYGSVSGFGIEGPHAKLPCYDNIAAARGGISTRSGRPDGPPVKPGYSICDNWSGLNLFNAVAMAMVEKERTGKGLRVDVAMSDCAFYLNDWPMLEYSVFGTIPMRNGNHDATVAPYGEFEAADGYVVLAITNDKHWGKFCDIMDLENIKDDSRFADNASRLENLKDLVVEIEKVTRTIPKFEIEKMLGENGVPAGAVMNIPEVMESEQAKASEMIVYVDQEKVGRMPTVGIPMKFSKTPGDVNGSAPMLGANTAEILKQVGYSEDNINELVEKNVVEVYSE